MVHLQELKFFAEEFGVKVIMFQELLIMISSVWTLPSVMILLNTAMKPLTKLEILLLLTMKLFFHQVMGRDAGFISFEQWYCFWSIRYSYSREKDSLEDLFKHSKSTKREKHLILLLWLKVRIASTYD